MRQQVLKGSGGREGLSASGSKLPKGCLQWLKKLKKLKKLGGIRPWESF